MSLVDPHTATADSVRELLRTGLPLTDAAPPSSTLLDLHGVTARSAQSDDPASRIRTLDALLRWQLAQYDHARWAEAARILFGATHDATGLMLTERREKAAAASGYEVHHFRKRIEPKICEQLAVMLNTDSEDLRARAVPPPLAPARTPLRLPADVFAWEAAEHEQALAQLWSGVFALRATLLATALAVSISSPDSPAATDAAAAALWQRALLEAAASAYRATYGPHILGSAPGTDPADLANLAGWQPPLPEAEALAEAAIRSPARADFLAESTAARSAPDWIQALTHCDTRHEGEI